MFQNLRTVPRLVFGRGCFKQIDKIIEKIRNISNSPFVFLVDDVFSTPTFKKSITLHDRDVLMWVNVDDEPKTDYVDSITSEIKRCFSSYSNGNPSGVVGIGGGSTMDLAKAVSLMLTNSGSSENYQGWDLIKNPAIYHVAVPTLSGTGAEVSRTAVLIGPQKKLGINSDYTVFDQIILDPDMIEGVPKLQRFYTGMDCYIHCTESLNGRYINTFSQAYAEKAIKLCKEVFLEKVPDANDKMMIASYFGGMSITYSQVGICHAMSYGLSFVTGIHHGLANCLIFNVLENFYPEEIQDFRDMMNNHQIVLPKHVLSNLPDDKIDKMISVALTLEPLWENALGKNWKLHITRSNLKELYCKI